MRISRKAGLLDLRVRWVKHDCARHQVGTGAYENGQSVWQLIESGKDANIWFQGTKGYEITWDGSKYVYAPSGADTSVSASNPGTVYQANGTMLERYTVSSDGGYSVRTCTLYTYPIYEVSYSVGDKIGAVRAEEGEYPDANKGYTYVTTEGEYTIMRDADKNYFAYIKKG